MRKTGYRMLGVINFIVALLTGFIYMPIALQHFGLNTSVWIDITQDILKSNYEQVLVYIGLIILVATAVLNLISMIYKTNSAKICFKISIIVALILPIIFVSAMEFEWAFKFWINNIASDIKMWASILIIVSLGMFGLGLIFNFIRQKRANFHHIIEAIGMCCLLIFVAGAYNWCGWGNVDKMQGMMTLWIPVYLLLSAFVLFICSKSHTD